MSLGKEGNYDRCWNKDKLTIYNDSKCANWDKNTKDDIWLFTYEVLRWLSRPEKEKKKWKFPGMDEEGFKKFMLNKYRLSHVRWEKCSLLAMAGQ